MLESALPSLGGTLEVPGGSSGGTLCLIAQISKDGLLDASTSQTGILEGICKVGAIACTRWLKAATRSSSNQEESMRQQEENPHIFRHDSVTAHFVPETREAGEDSAMTWSEC